MRRSRITGICVVVAFAISAVAAGAAAAEPEFVTKAAIGETVNSVPFTGTIGATFFEGATSKSKVNCNGGTFTGEVTGPKSLANIVITLTGCLTSEGRVENEGKPEGFVETKVLAGTLGAITPILPGIKLYSQAEGKGGKVIEAELGSGLVKLIWKGEVTGVVSGAAGENAETGKLLTAVKLTFAEKPYGKQRYQGFSEGPESGLLGQLEDVVDGTPELSGWWAPLTIKTVPSTWGLGVTK